MHKMIEQIKYINHINEVVEFGKDGIFANENALRDFIWKVTSKNDKITSFKKGVVAKTIPVIITCYDKKEALAKMDRLFEIMEKDVLANKHGKFIIGDYYLKCFVTSNKKNDYLNNYLKFTLTISTDYPSWVKETKIIFNESSGSTSEWLDYDYDYEYDYASEFNNVIVNNPGFVASDFKMIIYGFVANPTLYIDGHEYKVNVTVSTGEYLTIDSQQKTIVLTKYNGEQVNCFNKRSRDSYVFEKIKPGSNVVTCEGSMKADIILIEERSEPRWT